MPPTSPRSRPSRRALRWGVPVLAVGGVAAALTLPSTASAGSPDLPPRTAAQLLTDLGSADVTALSGTVVQTSRLGFPELPAGAHSSTSPLSLITGTNTLKVWYDGPQRERVALFGDLAEYDVARNGRDAWTYSSEQDQAVHYVLPASATKQRSAPATPGTLPTPAEAAKAVLAAVDPTTKVRVDSTATVAGRDAYLLVLEPKGSGSLVASVRVAIDAQTSAPLQVQVWGTADRATPAVDIGFTKVSFGRPDPSAFTFVPPRGASVKSVRVPAGAMQGLDSKLDSKKSAAKQRAEQFGTNADSMPVQVVGTGWTSVLVGAGVDASMLNAGGQAGELLQAVTTRVPEGRLLSTTLLSVLFTDDGRVLAGAVPAERLRAAAR